MFVVAVGCSTSCRLATAPGRSAAGIWSLETVGGNPLPHDDGYGFITYSVQFSLRSDGTYAEVVHQRLSDRSDTTFRSGGTWVQLNDTTILGTRTNKDNWAFYWKGDSLVESSPVGVPYVYRR